MSRALPAHLEDVSPDVLGQLPGIQYLVSLSLEPMGAPAAGRSAAWKMARSIAKSARGVIEDPQEGTTELPSGVKRFSAPQRAKESRVGILAMSWWLDHARLFERATLERLLAVMERDLPEAMPRRYGLWEPPQHMLEETGRAHLVDFLVDHLGDTIVWYAHRPVTHAFIAASGDPGWITHAGVRKFRCNQFSIELDAAVLDQPGWPLALRRAWHNLSVELAPFFGDVRTLHGHLASAGRIWSDRDTEPHPLRSWWFNGIPPRLGHAAVIGRPYLDAWPEFSAQDRVGELAFAATDDWRTSDDAADVVGGVPQRLALSFMPTPQRLPGGGQRTVWPQDYPPTFPFGPAGRP